MQLTFLSAKVPLTKTFRKNDDGSLAKDAYPLIKNFTSHSEECDSVEDFYKLLCSHAEQTHCLLKGNVKAPLEHESRAGSTDPMAPTRFVVFDIDGLEGIDSAETFIQRVLPPEFHKVSYIVQHSASSGIADDGMRAHLFFLMQNEVSPPSVKNWLKERNFIVPALADSLTLSSNSITLCYTLDTTVCQNDKLIYIAPPICEGFDDPLSGKRIELKRKKQDLVDYQFAARSGSELRGLEQQKVNELRKAAGLRVKHTKYKMRGGVEYLANPETNMVTGEKEVNGFIRLNLAGQNDSWGHYYNPERPLFLYNFKGEPTVILRDFLPDYYEHVVKPRLNDTSKEQPLVFRDMATDSYWNGLVDSDGRLIRLFQIGSKEKIEDSFANRGLTPPDPIPDWDYVFDPTTDTVIDWDNCRCNRWQPSDHIRYAEPVDEIPPVTKKLIHHVLAGDEKCIEHFINWIAYIYQYRTKTGTAWVLHGTQGTGKGLLFNNVLAPIFGKKYCVTKLLHDLDDKFNAYLETALLFNVDEARINDQGARSNKLVNQIKAMITEPTTTIRGMRENPREVRNFTNFIFTSNEYDAIRIPEGDRRHNVGPRQEEKLIITPDEVDALAIEAFAFAGYLSAYSVDKQQAHEVIHNDAKIAMRKASQTAIEQFADALETGCLDYFVDGLDSYVGNNDIVTFGEYKELVMSWVNDLKEDNPSIVSKKDAHVAYIALFSPRDMPLKKFVRMMEHKNLTFEGRFMVGNVRKRGRRVEWTDDADVQHSWNFGPSLKVIDGNIDKTKEQEHEANIFEHRQGVE